MDSRLFLLHSFGLQYSIQRYLSHLQEQANLESLDKKQMQGLCLDPCIREDTKIAASYVMARLKHASTYRYFARLQSRYGVKS